MRAQFGLAHLEHESADMSTTDFVVTTKVNIPPQRIADVITAGVEGGVNYWASDFLLKSPGAAEISGSPWYCKATCTLRMTSRSRCARPRIVAREGSPTPFLA